MNRSQLHRWAAVLALTVAPATSTASAEGEPLPPTLIVHDGSVREGPVPHLKDEHGRTSVFLQVTLTPTSEQTITVDYRTVDGTARSTTDYLAARGTLTFLPGETVQMIEVQMKPDRRPELDETFSVELSNAVGATIEDGTATVTIRDDD